MPKPLVLVGAGEFARIALEYFEHDSDRDVAAFSVEREYIAADRIEGRPVVAYETLEFDFPPTDFDVFVAVPASGLNRLRTRLFADARRRGYMCATYISSHAFVWRHPG